MATFASSSTGQPSGEGRDDETRSQHVPLVRYGKNNMQIPGDPLGFKFAHSGNVAHWNDRKRAQDFPIFPESDFYLQDEDWANSLLGLLSSLSECFVNNTLNKYEGFSIIIEDDNEKIVDFTFQSMSVRVIQFRDVKISDPKSYYRAQRAVDVENKSTTNMTSIEPPMGREVETMMMAQAIKEGKAPAVPRFRVSETHPQGGDNKKEWYKRLRTQVTRAFWVDHSRESRDAIRQAGTSPTDEIQEIVEEIRREDTCRNRDLYYQHHKDWAAVERDDIYERIDKDVLLIIDAGGKTILCSVQKLFQRLFGATTTEKVTDALKKWSALAPLPQPETGRHAVDELIRRDNHPELDMEKARTLEELEQRPSCVAHYGTWAPKGHSNPVDIYLTEDTCLTMYGSWRMFRHRPNYARELLPRFKRDILGSSSEVIRFLMRSVARAEYEDCLEIFRALPKEKKMPVSHPNWATLFVLGINSFTERHRDQTDVKQGFAGLVPLGEYEGGDLCFPQLGIKLAYQPGACVIFRGAEIEHFVQDWKGFRIFLLATNHQPIRNWAYRRLGKLEPLPSDPWFRGERVMEEAESPGQGKDEEEAGEDGYDVCFEEIIDEEDPAEGPWTDADLHGSRTWDPFYSNASSSSSGSQVNESARGGLAAASSGAVKES